MNFRVLGCSVVLAALTLSPPGARAQTKLLFDAAHAQTAGNADWVLDEDTCGVAQRLPNPDQSLIDASTPETFWSGALSAFGVDIVKKGYAVESLPAGGRFTYGDAGNPQDLSNYQILVTVEPNVRFTATEITAIRSFVKNGGGVLMIADHANSDRNNDGWDSPEILNELMGSPSLFGIQFLTDPDDPDAWFNDNPDVNYTGDTSSPIVYTGPYGAASSQGGLGLFGSTSMVLSTTANATVKGHVWRTGATPDTPTKVTLATAVYGAGRVVAFPDSSTAEDETNDCGHNTYPGYDDSRFDNGLLIANAIAWLAGGGGDPPPADTTSPTTPTNLTATAGKRKISLSWTASTDDRGVSGYEIWRSSSPSGPFTLRATTTSTTYTDAVPSQTTASYYVRAYDAAGNVSGASNVATATAR